MTMVEVVAVMAIALVIASLTVPLSATAVDTARVRTAAAFIGSRFRLARIEAVNRSANVGVVFDSVNGRWQLRICRDATGNGLRRSEIASGADPCIDGPYEFTAMFPGVAIAVDPQLTGPAGEPGTPDPVRFGTADIASFSPTGGCTAGSLFIQSARGRQFAVRLAGANGRLRVFRYDTGPRSWFQY
jgi:type II secretory pathway pseudopilin PulG